MFLFITIVAGIVAGWFAIQFIITIIACYEAGSSPQAQQRIRERQEQEAVLIDRFLEEQGLHIGWMNEERKANYRIQARHELKRQGLLK